MSNWTDFYKSIRADHWPDCDDENNFQSLPLLIQKECMEVFGYIPDMYKKKLKFENKVFPIQTKTACKLKWNWSTIYLTTEKTASCHRTTQHKFDTDTFNFHNTQKKINDRTNMLQGKWPDSGCDYCKSIEDSGGISDRITNLSLHGMHAPLELDTDPNAVIVTPRILEVYFDNVCNLKCLYCGPHFSSLWDAENIKFGDPAFQKSKNIEENKNKIFDWLKINGHNLDTFNILGGEPLYQREFDDCLNLFEQYPAPELKLQIFSNLNIRFEQLEKIISKVKLLVDSNKIREFEITASLDCWGEEQEYVRYPLNLASWEKNFVYLLEQSWINLIIGSTLTPLTIKTLPNLIQKINDWNKIRTVYHYQNSVNGPLNQMIDIFGNIFADDFDKAIKLKLERTPEEMSSKRYLEGIAEQAKSSSPKIQSIQSLFVFLNKIDYRRGTNWKKTFPWLIKEFEKYNLYAKD